MADDRKTDEDVTSPHLVRAYRRMLERAREILENETRPSLQDAVERARKSTVEFGEVTREEANEVADYLKRDLHDAGDYLSRTGRELREWAQIDLSMVEHGLVELFVRAADRTRLEMEAFNRELESGPLYRSGEMTGPGTLRCGNCGQLMHFHEPGHIPPLPQVPQDRIPAVYRRNVGRPWAGRWISARAYHRAMPAFQGGVWWSISERQRAPGKADLRYPARRDPMMRAVVSERPKQRRPALRGPWRWIRTRACHRAMPAFTGGAWRCISVRQQAPGKPAYDLRRDVTR